MSLMVFQFDVKRIVGFGFKYDLGHETFMGRVNHCSLHCRLARFRGLMINAEYSAVIGRETRFFCMPSNNFQAMGSFQPITAPYFPLIIKPRNFARLQCKLQWLTPPTFSPVQDSPGNGAGVWYRKKTITCVDRYSVYPTLSRPIRNRPQSRSCARLRAESSVQEMEINPKR